MLRATDASASDRLAKKAVMPTRKQRERLSSTLLAWLETGGGINDIAARLEIHRQTVRYRMHQIDEIFGDRLSDPEERLALLIALRTRRLLSPV